MTNKKTIKGPKGDKLKVTVRRKPITKLDPEDYEAGPIDLLDEGPEVSKPLARAYLDKKPAKKDPLRYKLSTQEYEDRCKVHEVALRLHRKHPEMRAQKITEHKKIIKIVGRHYYNPRTILNWVREVVKFPPGRPKKK
jgi:hypothetical protein